MNTSMHRIIWISSFAIIFLFVPSLALKIWDFLVGAPWQAKSWLFYILFALTLFYFAKWRWRKKSGKVNFKEKGSLLFIAKERLVKGEIGIEEFREIKRELE